ncbi:MAG: glycosyltransferase family 9 protein [bacterium]
MQEFTRIAIVKLSAIGDVVHALPVASALRERFPGAHLAWIVQGKCREILEGNPDLDEIIVFDKDRWLIELPYLHRSGSVIRDAYRFVRGLQGCGFDLAIDLQGLIKSGLLTWLTRAGTRIGFSADCCREPANARFTNCHVTPAADDVHIVDRCLSLVRGLGADTGRKRFNIHIPEDARAYIAKFLDSSKVPPDSRLVVINPGAGWETKLWGEENFAGLADRIVSDLGGRVIFLWGPSELPMVKAIQKKMQQPSLRACPTSLKQSLALMQRAHLFIAGDTGPLHMAAALGTPCVGLYGPSTPERNGPYGDIHRVVQADVSCRGCFRRFCSRKICMMSISVDQVMEAVSGMLSGTLQSGAVINSKPRKYREEW